MINKNAKFILFLILGVYIIIPIYDFYNFPRFEIINYANLILESVTSLFALSLFYAIQIQKKMDGFNWPLNMGMFFLISSTFVDAIDQIYIHSILFTAVFEKTTLILAFSLILVGILKWRTKYEEILLTDNLTKIPNRVAISKFVNSAIASPRKPNQELYLAILDIDFFKNINDNYGHDVGDNILIEFSQLLKKLTKPMDKFGRWGGEEFIFLLNEYDDKEAFDYFDNIRIEIRNHKFKVGSNQIQFTVSIGLTKWEKQNSDYESLFLQADKALYQAKNRGRNSLAFSHPLT